MSRESDEYQRLCAILEGARALPGPEREAYVARSCGADRSLRTRIEELLAAALDQDADDAFADHNVAGVRSTLEQALKSDSSEWLPERIGDYTILRRLGSGGMGVVYEAEQESPRRRVAIKLLHPMHATKQRLRRFRQEAEVLGRLQHPGIAQIFEAGHYDIGRGPQPFFAMELVDGVDLRTHCERHNASTNERIELLARVADAVQYAHERGIIHRDLKPDNVLVDRQGNPRVLDFGIARTMPSADALSTSVTEAGQMVGTLSYMAPEQLTQSSGAITAAVDVYALGVLGFELMVGRLPHLTNDLPVSQAITLLSTREAPRAGSFNPNLRGDIETILGTALASERKRRYASAAAFVSDLRRTLEHQPIRARQPSGTYLVGKFVRRHKALVGGVLATLIVSIAGAVVAARFAVRATQSATAASRSAADATTRADQLERANYIAGIAAASSAVDHQDYATAAELLDGVPARHRGWEYDYLRARLVHHLDEWETPAAVVSTPVFDADGKRMFAALEDGSIGTWEVASGALLGTWPIDGILEHSITSVRVVLHGPRLRYAAALSGGDVVVGDLESGERQLTVDTLSPAALGAAPPQVFAWDPAGQQLLYSCGSTRVWNGVESRLLSAADRRGAFSPSGDRLVRFGERFGHHVLCDVRTGDVLREAVLDDTLTHLEFSPDEQTIAIAGHTRNVFLVDATNLELVTRLPGHQDIVYDVAFSPDGSRLVSTSEDGTLRVWDTARLGSATVHRANVTDHRNPGKAMGRTSWVAVAPDGQSVIAAGDRIRRFPLDSPFVLRGHATYVYYVTFSPDGTRLASSCFGDPHPIVWDLLGREPPWKLQLPAVGFHAFGGCAMIAFSDDGRRVVAATGDKVIHADVSTRAALPVSSNIDLVERISETLGSADWRDHSEVVFAPDGRRLARRYTDTVYIHDCVQQPTSGANPMGDLRRRPDVTATVEDDKTLVGKLEGHIGSVYSVAFSPDGTRIATGGNDTTVRIWDARTFEQLLVLRGHDQYVYHLAFSPDGSRLASASGDTTIRLWDTKPLHERRAQVRDD